MDWGDRGEHMTTGGWIFMALGMLVPIVLVVVLVMWIVSQQRMRKKLDASAPAATGPPAPLPPEHPAEGLTWALRCHVTSPIRSSRASIHTSPVPLNEAVALSTGAGCWRTFVDA